MDLVARQGHAQFLQSPVGFAQPLLRVVADADRFRESLLDDLVQAVQVLVVPEEAGPVELVEVAGLHLHPRQRGPHGVDDGRRRRSPRQRGELGGNLGAGLRHAGGRGGERVPLEPADDSLALASDAAVDLGGVDPGRLLAELEVPGVRPPREALLLRGPAVARPVEVVAPRPGANADGGDLDVAPSQRPKAGGDQVGGGRGGLDSGGLRCLLGRARPRAARGSEAPPRGVPDGLPVGDGGGASAAEGRFGGFGGRDRHGVPVLGEDGLVRRRRVSVMWMDLLLRRESEPQNFTSYFSSAKSPLHSNSARESDWLGD